MTPGKDRNPLHYTGFFCFFPTGQYFHDMFFPLHIVLTQTFWWCSNRKMSACAVLKAFQWCKWLKAWGLKTIPMQGKAKSLLAAVHDWVTLCFLLVFIKVCTGKSFSVVPLLYKTLNHSLCPQHCLLIQQVGMVTKAKLNRYFKILQLLGYHMWGLALHLHEQIIYCIINT